MKISCLKEDLAHGLGVVSHALPTTRVLMHRALLLDSGGRPRGSTRNTR